MTAFFAQVREKWKWSRRGIPPPPSWYCKGDEAWILECKITPEEKVSEVRPPPVYPDIVTVGIWSEWGMKDEKFSFSLLRLEELGFDNLVTRINKASKKKPFLVDNDKESVRLHRSYGDARLTILVLNYRAICSDRNTSRD